MDDRFFLKKREPEDFQSPLIVNETYRFIGKIAQLAHGEKILRYFCH
jgi:hypothetical protein